MLKSVEMEKKITQFKEHEYYVDIPRDALVRVTDPEMVINLRTTAYKEHQGYDWGSGVIPELVTLDPVGMSEHYRIPLSQLKGKSDFDVIVNKHLVELRLAGVLPELEIVGHPFYVDIRMGGLRPKDDFSTMGISFRDIDDFFDYNDLSYRIPYHPGSRTFRELDSMNLLDIPTDILLVRFPHVSALDPIGFARERGLDARQVLRRAPPYSPMKAEVIPWETSRMEEIINWNRMAKGLPCIAIRGNAEAIGEARKTPVEKPKIKTSRRL